jgi:hypothetical protein
MIDEFILKKIITYNLTLDQALILYCKCTGTKSLTHYRPANSEYDQLIFNEYLTPAKNITKAGTSLCKEIFFTTEHNTNIEDEFENWWDCFPSNDAHGNYSPRRLIKTGSKQKAKAIYMNIVINKNITSEFLLSALNKEIEFRKKNSTKENQLSYLQSPVTWLTNETYLLSTSLSENNNTFSEYGKSIS